MAGSLALVGDDHGAVSSTLPTQSEHNFSALMMPVLHPASVQEYLDFGLLGWAMSRYCGTWIGFKCLTETVESSASVTVDPDRLDIVVPDDEEPTDAAIRLGEDRLQIEARLQEDKVYAALRFARENRIDRTVWDSPNPRLGILTAGKSYLDVRQALDDLGNRRESRGGSSASGSTRRGWSGRWSAEARAPSPTGWRKSSSSRKSAR